MAQKCERCGQEFDTEKMLSSHRRFCKKKNTQDTSRAGRETEQGGATGAGLNPADMSGESGKRNLRNTGTGSSVPNADPFRTSPASPVIKKTSGPRSHELLAGSERKPPAPCGDEQAKPEREEEEKLRKINQIIAEQIKKRAPKDSIVENIVRMGVDRNIANRLVVDALKEAVISGQRGSRENNILIYSGTCMMAAGFILWLGSALGIFEIFSWAGIITIVIGAFLFKLGQAPEPGN